jgi:RNA polymerase sigma factor (sigma-70 family)
LDDHLLAQELRKGSAIAFENMVYRYHGPLYAYLYRMLNAKPLAEDMVQECFLRAMEAIRKGNVPDQLRPWLYRIAANLCKDHWRRTSSRNEVLFDASDRDDPSGSDTVASIFERQAERERVVAAVHRLATEKRNLIVLRFYQELKLEEIARVLELPLSTVKSRLYQSLGELHRYLMEDNKREEAQAQAEGGRA